MPNQFVYALKHLTITIFIQDQLSSLLRTAVNLKIRGLAEGCNEASLDKMDQDNMMGAMAGGRPTSAASVSTPSVSGSSPEKPSGAQHPTATAAAASVIPGAQNNNSANVNGEDELDPLLHHHQEKQLHHTVGGQPLGTNSEVAPPPPKRKRGG